MEIIADLMVRGHLIPINRMLLPRIITVDTLSAAMATAIPVAETAMSIMDRQTVTEITVTTATTAIQAIPGVIRITIIRILTVTQIITLHATLAAIIQIARAETDLLEVEVSEVGKEAQEAAVEAAVDNYFNFDVHEKDIFLGCINGYSFYS